MSRLYDYLVIGVVTLISIIVHLVSVYLFAPETKLHDLASMATQFNGAARADLWFEILAVWAPMIATGGIICWGFVRELRRQSQTVRTPR